MINEITRVICYFSNRLVRKTVSVNKVRYYEVRSFNSFSK